MLIKYYSKNWLSLEWNNILVTPQASQAHVLRKSKQLINESITLLCDLVLSYKRNHWEFEHVIRNSMGNKISSIYKMKSRLHARILTVVHAEAVCTLKILPISIFLSQRHNRNNSDSKACLKWHRLPGTQDVSKFYWFCVKCS